MKSSRLAAWLCVVQCLGYAGWCFNFIVGQIKSSPGTHATADGMTLLLIIYCGVGLAGFAMAAVQLFDKETPTLRTARGFTIFDLASQCVFFPFRMGSGLLLALSLLWFVIDVVMLAQLSSVKRELEARERKA